jgi:hypothetical protein
MSDRVSQPFPQASTGRTILRFGVELPWSIPPASLRDVHFLRSWLEYDSELHEGRTRRGLNWYPIVGMVVTVAVSAAFWTGVGLMVMRFWK